MIKRVYEKIYEFGLQEHSIFTVRHIQFILLLQNQPYKNHIQHRNMFTRSYLYFQQYFQVCGYSQQSNAYAVPSARVITPHKFTYLLLFVLALGSSNGTMSARKHNF